MLRSRDIPEPQLIKFQFTVCSWTLLIVSGAFSSHQKWSRRKKKKKSKLTWQTNIPEMISHCHWQSQTFLVVSYPVSSQYLDRTTSGDFYISCKFCLHLLCHWRSQNNLVKLSQISAFFSIISFGYYLGCKVTSFIFCTSKKKKIILDDLYTYSIPIVIAVSDDIEVYIQEGVKDSN